MEYPYIIHEYCARLGLFRSGGELSDAFSIAQVRFEEFIGRVTTADEEQALKLLIEEIAERMSAWGAPKSYVISAT